MILTYFDRLKHEVKQTEYQKIVEAINSERGQKSKRTNRFRTLVQHIESFCGGKQYCELIESIYGGK